MMSFTSFKFFLFFAIVYFLLWVIKWIFGNKNAYFSIFKAFLLFASYVFLVIADWRFFACILALTAITYYVALKSKKNIIVGVVLAVLQLAVFKYFNFFVGSISNLIGYSYNALNIIIPLGVSFYTFSAIGYLIDVYKEKYQPEKDFLNLALFISFFPKLISGPIVKADRFFSQLSTEPTVNWARFKTGIQIVVVGLFKKMVLADHLGVFVNDVFGAPTAFSGSTVFLATIAYSLQIYFDFSGYSEIAIGLSRMIGFDFDKNFNLPYLSTNPTEFWKRWHISLSAWLQEYLYIPLGGNRKGKARTYLNLFLTMLIGGLWHGANWTYIVWGATNGLALVIHKLFVLWKIKKFGNKNAGNIAWKIVSGVLMFFFANLCWIFFRANSIENAVAVIKQIFFIGNGLSQPYSWVFVSVAVAICEMIFAVYRKSKNHGKIMQEYLNFNLSNVWQLAIFFALIGIIIMTAYFGDTAFIYGAF